MPIAAIAKLTAQPGRREELLVELRKLVDGTASEPGTLAYVLHTVVGSEDAVVFYELYTDQAALDAHSRSDTMKAVGPALAGLLGAPPEFTMATPVAGKDTLPLG